MTTVYVPVDSSARSVGADEVADALAREARERGLDMTLVRNGSRGLLWLEPLVEVATDRGRVAYGPVAAADVPGLFDAGFLDGAEHPLGHGRTDDIEWLASQQRLTFARVGVTDPLSPDDYEAHGGLAGLRRALELDPADLSHARRRLGPARPRRRRLPDRHQVAHGAADPWRPEVRRAATPTRATAGRSPTGC